MDSINQQQEERNHEDLQSTEAVKKIQDLAEKASTCFFCTKITTGMPLETRPMSVQKVDEAGNIWFLCASDSNLKAEIEADSNVHLLFQGSPHSHFLSVYGTATISQDKNKIKELWEPIAKTWFTEGEDDPRIRVIKVVSRQGYYWDNKHGNAVAMVKMAIGAVMGKTLDDSIEGTIKL